MSNVEILPQVAAFLDRRHGCFIDGQWVFAEGQSIAVLNPATGQTLCQTLDAPPELVERAVVPCRVQGGGVVGPAPGRP
jgi:phenylacetaldehyde dehydrogenase